MRITRQADYAIRIVAYLSGHSGDSVVTVEKISDEMTIPRSFAAKIVQKLTRAGLTNSMRGVKGGFFLKKKPAEMSLLEVVEAVDGPIDMNICVLNEDACSRVDVCEIHPVWVNIQKDVRKLLAAKDFASILENSHSAGG